MLKTVWLGVRILELALSENSSSTWFRALNRLLSVDEKKKVSKTILKPGEVSLTLNLDFLGNFDPFIIKQKNLYIFSKIVFFLRNILL